MIMSVSAEWAGPPPSIPDESDESLYHFYYVYACLYSNALYLMDIIMVSVRTKKTPSTLLRP